MPDEFPILEQARIAAESFRTGEAKPHVIQRYMSDLAVELQSLIVSNTLDFSSNRLKPTLWRYIAWANLRTAIVEPERKKSVDYAVASGLGCSIVVMSSHQLEDEQDWMRSMFPIKISALACLAVKQVNCDDLIRGALNYYPMPDYTETMNKSLEVFAEARETGVMPSPVWVDSLEPEL